MFFSVKTNIACLILNLWVHLSLVKSSGKDLSHHTGNNAQIINSHNDNSDSNVYVSKIEMKNLAKDLLNYFPNVTSPNSKKYIKKSRKGSLAFVFDATGSMHDDLVQLQEGAEMILNTMAHREDSPIVNYVLVPYRDPEVDDAIVTKDENELREALSNIRIYGGGNCPEMSVSAIERALNVSLPYSFIYVFTDASAVDHYIVERVLSLIQRKSSQVFFVLTGDCNDRNNRTFQVYEEIAAASSGQIFDLNKTEVIQILKFVNESLKANKVNLESATFPSGYDYKHEIPIDDSIKDVTISISGKDPEITVRNPKGEEVNDPSRLISMLDLSQIKIITIVNPDPGNWSIIGGSNEKHSVKITGTSNLNFDYGFSQNQETKRISDTINRPLEGKSSSLFIKLIDGFDNVDRIHSVEILKLSGKLLFEIPLTAINDSDDPYLYKTNPFSPPNEFFHISINGMDKEGNSIRRIGSNAVLNQLPDVPFIEVASEISIPIHGKLELICKVVSSIPVDVWWFKDGKPIMNKQNFFESGEINHIINNIDRSSEGIYICTASNSKGISKAKTAVSVTEEYIVEPIKIEAYPEVVEYQKGEYIQFYCHLHGSKFAVWDTPVLKDEKLRVQQYEIETDNFNDLLMTIRIKNSSVEDEGFYKCKGFKSDTDKDFIEAVVQASYIEKPKIQMNPNNNVLYQIDEKVTLDCNVSGAPKPAVSWVLPDKMTIRKGISSNDKFSVNDKNQLIVNSIRKEDQGTYTCTAKNKFGSAEQQYFVNIWEKLSFLETSMNVTINVLDSLVLTCNVSGYPVPQINWFHNRKQLQFQTETLVLNSATFRDSGKYSCIAENDYENINNDFYVTVNGEVPNITLTPKSSIFLPGKQLEIICSVESQIPILNTTLFFTSKPSLMNNQEKQPVDSILSKENETTIFSYNIITSQETEGLYSCESSNIVGVAEKTIRLDVLPLLIVNVQPELIEYESGNYINFTCNISGSKFGMWLRSDSSDSSDDLFLDSNIEMISNTTPNDDGISLILSIKNSSELHQGKYECVGFRNYLEDKESVKFEVMANYVEKPNIFEFNENIEIEIGSTLNTICNVSGIPQPSVIWILPNNTEINDASLVVENVSTEHEGLYICRTQNEIGSSEKAMEVFIWSVPKFTEHLKNQTVDIYGDTDLACEVSGNPKPEIVWYHDNVLIDIQAESNLQIKNASLKDAGNYTCEVKNDYGNIAESLYVQISGLHVPEIEKSGNKITVNEGEKLAIDCRVLVGEPKPNIKWLKNNSSLNDDIEEVKISNNVLEIKSAIEKHKGNYTCVAENAIGIDKHEFNVVVYIPPKFEEDLEKVNIIDAVSGNSVNFSCDAAGNPKPFITWTKDGFPVHITNSTYIDSNNTLMLLETKETDSGTYICVASNFLGQLQKKHSLSVYAKPSILNNEEPSILQFIEGELITLPCFVYGIPRPEVKWMLNDNEIILSEHKQIDSVNSLRFIANLTDSGFYKCEAINKYGNASQQYFVFVFVPPTIYPDKNEIIETTHKSEVVFECHAIGFPEPTINWRKNGEILSKNSTELIFNNYGKLIILNASSDTSGNYICSAENVAGVSEKNFKLILNEPPTILSSNISSHIQLLKGSREFRIPCQASGNPPPHIIWLKDEVIVINSLNHRIEVDNTLVLRYVVEDMSGVYTCSAINFVGSVDVNYNVEVLVPPAIQDKDHEVTIIANEGSSVVLKCPLKPMMVLPNIIWHKDSEIIEENSNATNLMFLSVNRNDASHYSCFVNNTAGQVLGTLILDVQWPPDLLENKDDDNENHFRLLEGDSLSLVCNVDANPPADIHWMKDGEDTGESSSTLKIKYLKFHHAGEYTCSASNLLGEIEKKILVQVLGPPKIDGPEFNDIQIRVNRPLKLECPSHGLPKPKVKWNTKHAPDWNIIGNGNTLRTYNISINSSGMHSCEVSNDVGVAIKQFNISVLEPPKIKRIQFYDGSTSKTWNSTAFKEHSHLIVKCDVEGSHPFEIMWVKNGKIQKTQNLTFEDLILADAGKYTCLSRNKVGLDEMDFNIDVLIPPKIHFEPDEISAQTNTSIVHILVFEDQSIKLNCHVSGNPIPDIYWFKEKNYMGFYDASVVTEEYGQVLHIKSVMKKHHGNYTCEARNLVGDTKKRFFLDVLTAPMVIQQQDVSFALSAKTGQNVYMECPTVSNPDSTTRWLKHPHFELQDEQDHISFIDDNTTLVINNVSVSDSGNYSCIATNLVGMAEITYSLEVFSAPKLLPFNEKKLNVNNDGVIATKIRRSFQLFCNAHGYPEPTITWYKDGYLINPSKYNDSLHLSFDGRYFNMMDTTMHDSGIYSCKAENTLGISEKEFKVKILVPAEWSMWSEWSTCSSTCGIGYQQKSRKCFFFGDLDSINIYNNENNDLSTKTIKLNSKMEPKSMISSDLLDKSSCVGDAIERRDCQIVPCKIDGGWGDWTEWTTCSVLCGFGTKKRYRKCNNPVPKYGGDPCKGLNNQQTKCHANQCSEWSSWSPWSDCSVSCGKGTKIRTRQCGRPTSCVGSPKEIITCEGTKCNVDGGWSQWSAWSSCSATCGKGYKRRTRMCNNPLPQFNGKKCDGTDLQIEVCSRTLTCNEDFDSTEEQIEELTDLTFHISKQPKNSDKEKNRGIMNKIRALYPEDSEEKEGPIDIDKNDLCQSGFMLNFDDEKCIDINECLIPNNDCHSTQMCENVPGSYKCFCQQGYMSAGIGQRCLDVNECSQNKHSCSHECLNTPGSFYCLCPPKYTLSKDQRTCIIASNIDDDSSNKEVFLTNSEELQDYINTGNKFDTKSIHEYSPERNIKQLNNFEYYDPQSQMDNLKKMKNHISLSNINETSPDISCTSGFLRISDKCIDIDECSSDMNSCNGITNLCINTHGSYTCIPTPCPKGFLRDIKNKVCTKKCDIPRTTCLQNSLQYENIKYIAFSTTKTLLKLPGDVLNLEYGGKVNNTEYHLESQPREKGFSVRIEQFTGVLHIYSTPPLGRIYRIVIGCSTYNSKKMVNYLKLIIYLYIY